jgi:PIN domain nuclease of toxin-antitoxin system
MPLFVLDTHVLLFFLADSPRLGKAADAALEDPESRFVLPAIALAEALWIASSRKIDLSTSKVTEAIDGDPRIDVCPLDREIVELAHTLTSIPEMHDRQIAATTLILARHESNVLLLTQDAAIIDSGLVQTAW